MTVTTDQEPNHHPDPYSGHELLLDRTAGSTTPIPDAAVGITPRAAARLAGVSYVVLFALGVFANFFVREGLIVSDDAQVTAANIAESPILFRLGIASFLIIFLLDVVVAWALHIVFRQVNRDLSLLAAWFRIVYTVLLGVALVYFFDALQLLNDTNVFNAIGAEQREAQALAALNTFNSAWLIGLAGFGIHLVILGALLIRFAAGPKLLGWILIAAGSAYVIDTTAYSLLADYVDYETIFVAMVAIPAVIAEGWFALWLLFRAGVPSPIAGQGNGSALVSRPAKPASVS